KSETKVTLEKSHKSILKKLPDVVSELPAKASILKISQPKKNMLVIPYDTHTPYISVILKEYPYLFLYNSDKHNDAYELKFRLMFYM
ncbi:16868_t:CDS:1, partial [Funneliformis mosseae]